MKSLKSNVLMKSSKWKFLNEILSLESFESDLLNGIPSIQSFKWNPLNEIF